MKKQIINISISHYIILLMTLSFAACSDDDAVKYDVSYTGRAITNEIYPKADGNADGSITFTENTDGTTTIQVTVNGSRNTDAPVELRSNSAAAGGTTILTLEPIPSLKVSSVTVVSKTDDGNSVTYNDLIAMDGYVVVFSDDLKNSVIADGDLGQNAFTDESKTYDLATKDVDGISGSITFTKRLNGFTHAQINLSGTPDGGVHPAHIHANSAVEGGGIMVSLNPIDGNSGSSFSSIDKLDDGTALTYDELLNLDGYVNVHLSSTELGTIVAQGDIGSNELTGTVKEYTLNTKDVADINGKVIFQERKNGFTLATIQLEGTPEGGTHPAHIHQNTAVEGGGIMFTFNPVDGTTGVSKTNIRALDDGTSFVYGDVLSVVGYINVHLSATELGTIVAQGDIGGNVLTGDKKEYKLYTKDVDGILGTLTLAKRVNGTTLATIAMEGTPDGGTHPAHIHANTAVEGGGIMLTFNPIDGTTGASLTQLNTLDDGTDITYSQLQEIDAYVNVHLSPSNLGTIVAQGDIGQNELTGDSKTYDLNEVASSGVSGTAKFEKRVNNETLVSVMLSGTVGGGSHPTHIHVGKVEENTATPILITLSNVDGATGVSQTNVTELDIREAITYDGMIALDGYINIHLSDIDLNTIVAQGNVGAN